MADGSMRPIYRVWAGDHVISRDPTTGAASVRRVKARLDHPPERVVAITVEGVDHPVHVTPHHLLHADGQWTRVGHIPLQAKLSAYDLTTYEPRVARLLTRTASARLEPVFNLEIEDASTYLVETFAVKVHKEPPHPPPLREYDRERFDD